MKTQQGRISTGWMTGIFSLLLLAGGAIGAWLWLPVQLTQTPERRAAVVAPLDLPLTYLAIPIVVPIEDVKQQVREAISGKMLGSGIKVPDREITISVERNGPLVLWVKKARLHMELPLEFEIEGDLDTDGEITLITDATFDVAPDWSPALKVKNSFRWDWQPRVGFWPFRFRIGDRLAPYIQKALNAQAETMQEEARSKFKLREMAQAGWNQLQTPMALGRDDDTWLVLKPSEAWAEPITSDDSDININFWIGALPTVIYGARPAEPAHLIPLADLQRGQPPHKSLILDHALRLSYDELAQSALSKVQASAATGLPYPVQVEQLSLYPSGEKMALRVQVSAQTEPYLPPVKASLFATASPVWDTEQGGVRLTDAQWTEPENHPIPRRGLSLRSAELLNQLTAALVWPIGESLMQSAATMNDQVAQVSGKSFEFLGGLEELQTMRLVLHADTLNVDLRSKGEASIIVRP